MTVESYESQLFPEIISFFLIYNKHYCVQTGPFCWSWIHNIDPSEWSMFDLSDIHYGHVLCDFFSLDLSEQVALEQSYNLQGFQS